METGVELIAKERQEQIKKHKFDDPHDDGHTDYEIANAAKATIDASLTRQFPHGWEDFAKKILSKTYKERLVIAGALIAAEIDRLTRKGTQN